MNLTERLALASQQPNEETQAAQPEQPVVPDQTAQGESVEAPETPTEQVSGDPDPVPDPRNAAVEAIRKDLSGKLKETRETLAQREARVAELEAKQAEWEALKAEHERLTDALPEFLQELEEKRTNEVAGKAQVRALYQQLVKAQKEGALDSVYSPEELQQIAAREVQAHMQWQAAQRASQNQPSTLTPQQLVAILDQRDQARARAEQERQAAQSAEAMARTFTDDFSQLVARSPAAKAHEEELRILFETTGKKPSDFAAAFGAAPAASQPSQDVLKQKVEARDKAVPTITTGPRATTAPNLWGSPKPLPLRERLAEFQKSLAEANRAR